jgi:hypothetical protein
VYAGAQVRVLLHGVNPFRFNEFTLLRKERMTRMPENSWCNAKPAKSGSMACAWVTSPKISSTMTIITASSVNQSYIKIFSSMSFMPSFDLIPLITHPCKKENLKETPPLINNCTL